MIRDASAGELIQLLDQLDESVDIEAKEISEDSLGRSVWETVCAFSNEPGLDGGTLLLGVRKVEELFTFYEASGVGDLDKLINDLASGAASVFNVPVRLNIVAEKVGDANVIRVDVPEAHVSQKPVYLKNLNLPRGAMRRIGSSDQHCTQDDLIAFFHSKANEPHDTHVVSDVTFSDINLDALEFYRGERVKANPLAEELNWPDDDVLISLGAAKRVDGDLAITATGLYCFGTSLALRRVCPMHRVDYIRVPGKAWLIDDVSTYESLDMRDSVILLIGKILNLILSDLPKTFRFDENSGQRREIPAIPQRVIREAVVNAIMHRNYQEHRPIQIIKYSNRLVIRNPGYSLKSEDRFDEPGSAVRNPHIAEILHETRFAEQKGSGIRVMRNTMAEMGLSTPTFVSDRGNDEFSATFLFHHFLGETDWKWLSNFASYDLSEDDMRALIFVRETGAIDNSAYRGMMHVDTLAASKSLRHLKSLGLLEDRGSGSRTHYVPGPSLSDFLSDDASMHVKVESIITKTEDSPTKTRDLPPGLQARVVSMPKRLPPERAEKMIVDLCAWKPLSAEELAGILGKTTNYLSNKYLYQMVRDGKLHYLYPKMVKHPGQKYKVEAND